MLLGLGGITSDTTARRHRNKRESNPRWNPRPLNSFMLYRKTYVARRSVDKQRAAGRRSHTKHGLSKEAGLSWKGLPEPVKKAWADFAVYIEGVHKQYYPNYTYKPRPRGSAKVCRSASSTSRDSPSSDDDSTYADPIAVQMPTRAEGVPSPVMGWSTPTDVAEVGVGDLEVQSHYQHLSGPQLSLDMNSVPRISRGRRAPPMLSLDNGMVHNMAYRHPTVRPSGSFSLSSRFTSCFSPRSQQTRRHRALPPRRALATIFRATSSGMRIYASIMAAPLRLIHPATVVTPRSPARPCPPTP
jgi:hypothetical protein